MWIQYISFFFILESLNTFWNLQEERLKEQMEADEAAAAKKQELENEFQVCVWKKDQFIFSPI